jgi:hypothetical protein
MIRSLICALVEHKWKSTGIERWHVCTRCGEPAWRVTNEDNADIPLSGPDEVQTEKEIPSG